MLQAHTSLNSTKMHEEKIWQEKKLSIIDKQDDQSNNK